MYPESFVHPPRIAAWLVDLFASSEQAESIAGDLLEEFSELASKSGVSIARRWYWRQTAKTIVHLVGIGFRTAPWSTAVTVVAGFVLLRFASGLIEPAMFAVLRRYDVFERHFNVYVFFATYGIGIGRVIVSMLGGCIVALVAKGREIIATMMLALVPCALIGAVLVWLPWRGHMDVEWLLWLCADPFAVVIGGVIVRTSRSGRNTSFVRA
jgi:hypothetical protein